MNGILIVTHGDLGQAMVRCAGSIVGNTEHLVAVGIDAHDSHEVALRRIREARQTLDALDGLLVLTDMFGGTPSNVSLTMLETGRVEVVSGVNMPMLLHAINARGRGLELSKLAANVAASGRKNVIVAGALLGQDEPEDG